MTGYHSGVASYKQWQLVLLVVVEAGESAIEGPTSELCHNLFGGIIWGARK